MYRFHNFQKTSILAALLIALLSTVSCENDESAECKECSEGLFLKSIEEIEVQVVFSDLKDAWLAVPITEYNIAYKLCSAWTEAQLGVYDILTISGSLFEPCDSSSLQNIKIESYEITGQVFRECSMPENESTGLIDLDCAIDETVREKYTEVAANLTCLSHEDNQDFLIDESTPEYFLKALSAVYNSGLPEANFVMKERPIIGRSYCHQTVCLELDKTFDWTQRILNGDKISGNATFDSLVNVAAFEISASEFLGYADLIPTVKAINVDSMATFFTPIEGVISAETCPNNLIGDGGYLSYHSYPDQLQINFSLGYGDCPSGCIYRTNWNFIIHEDCSVVLLENCGNLRPSHNEIGY